MYLLVDTNVFLDLFLDRDSDEIAKFFRNCVLRSNKTFVTSLTLRDVEYTVHNHFHDSKVSRQIQSQVYSMSSKVIGISADSAINSLFSDVKDYEDSLQIEAAKEAMLDCIITNNKKDFKNGGIPVYTPKEINDIWDKSPRIIID